MALLSWNELKAACRSTGLDDEGREKALLVDRLADCLYEARRQATSEAQVDKGDGGHMAEQRRRAGNNKEEARTRATSPTISSG